MSLAIFLTNVEEVLSPQQIIIKEQDCIPYSQSPRGFYSHTISAILLPETTEQVSFIMRVAHETKTAIIPQGGNTGLVGAQQGVDKKTNIILSLNRMNNIIDIDVKNLTVLVESGVVLERLQQKVEKLGVQFPLRLASQGSCQIGGNLSTNAGGTAVLSYGTMRDLCLGLEVVLPDGRVLNDLRFVKKDNSGYDIKNLFIGAEGTLGIITKAVLKLFPKPKERYVAYVACENIEHSIAFFQLAKASFGSLLTACELVSHFAMQLSLNYMRKANMLPLATAAPWYVLIEITRFSLLDGCDTRLEALIDEGLSLAIIKDAVIAQNMSQEIYFWQLRENLSYAQKHEGVSIKNDIALSATTMSEFITAAKHIVSLHCAQARIVCFGHLGDGNLHYNILVPQGYNEPQSAAFLALWQPISWALNSLVAKLGGSIAAEHGIGQLKRDALQSFKDPVAYALMLNIKQQFDPHNIMNPHKVLNG